MWFLTERCLPSKVLVVKTGEGNKGFTLLEVMIAVAIIAIALVTLLGAQSQSVSIASGAKFDTMASMLAQWKMSDLLLQDYGELSDDEGNFGTEYPQFAWKLTVTELSEGETGLPGTADQIKALDIAVISTLDSRQEFSLRTFVFNRPHGAGAALGENTSAPAETEQQGQAVEEGEGQP